MARAARIKFVPGIDPIGECRAGMIADLAAALFQKETLHRQQEPIWKTASTSSNGATPGYADQSVLDRWGRWPNDVLAIARPTDLA